MLIDTSSSVLQNIKVTKILDCTIAGPTVNQYTTTVIAPSFVGTGAFGLGKYVGIGFDNGGLYPASTYYTYNGITWYATAAGVNAEYRICAFGNNRFVAVAGNSFSSNKNAVSLDGINWTHYSNMPSSAFWYGLGFGAGKFVAGKFASSALASSTTGITWTAYATTLPGVDAIAYGNGVWMSSYRFAATIYRSLDAIAWAPVAPNLPADSIAFSNGLFFTRMFSTTTNQYNTSPDGLIWTPRLFPAVGYWQIPQWNGVIWVVWGIIGGVGKFYWSPDLTTWNILSPTTTNSNLAAYVMGLGRLVLYQGIIGKSFTVTC